MDCGSARTARLGMVRYDCTSTRTRIVWSELHVLHSRVFYDPVCTGTSHQKGTDGAAGEYEYPYEYPVNR